MIGYNFDQCRVFAPSNTFDKLELRPIIEASNAFKAPGDPDFSPKRLILGRYKYVKADKKKGVAFSSLPGAVLKNYGENFGREEGREIVRKGKILLSIHPIKGKFGNIITEKMGFRHLILSSCWGTIKGIIRFETVAIIFPFGIGFNRADFTPAELKKAMEAAAAWLPYIPEIEIREVEL